MLSNEEFKAGILDKVKQKELCRKRRIKIISAVIAPCICLVAASLVFAANHFGLSNMKSYANCDQAIAENAYSVYPSDIITNKSDADCEEINDYTVKNPQEDSDFDENSGIPETEKSESTAVSKDIASDSSSQTPDSEIYSFSSDNPATDSLLSLSLSKYGSVPKKSVTLIQFKEQLEKIKNSVSKEVYSELSARLSDEYILTLTLPGDSIYQAADLKSDALFITVYLYKSGTAYPNDANASLIITSLPKNKYHGQIVKLEFIN